MRTRKLFLDCDGVLADFASYAFEIFGLPPRDAEAKHGTKRFWQDPSGHPDFFNRLPLMPDARALYEAVKHLHPTILTGMPPLGDWAEPQKKAWAARHFPGTPVICCPSKDKCLHLQPGDVLVDDYLKYRQLWIDAGGTFVHHTSAAASIECLQALGIL
jgi:hypothetical protein